MLRRGISRHFIFHISNIINVNVVSSATDQFRWKVRK